MKKFIQSLTNASSEEITRNTGASMLDHAAMNTPRRKLTLRHPFHLVKPSGWPILVSLWLPTILVFFTLYLYPAYSHVFQCPFIVGLFILTLILFTLTVAGWFSDVVTESTFQGNHTITVRRGLRFGFILFIVSEIMFFFGFFWSFFHSAFNPSIFIGATWPPEGVQTLNAWNIPFLNTCILLSSGVAVTASHHALRLHINRSSPKSMFFSTAVGILLLTIAYGVFFTLLQVYEYTHSTYHISTNIFGSTFFIITGLHGFHVLVGTVFLVVQALRIVKYHPTAYRHVGYESAIWYWHFVDIVWLFVFSTIYVWSCAV